MAYLVGTDEAGYGPNLGPLVVSATVWRVDSLEDTDLYARLCGVVSSEPRGAGDQLVVADSKALYKPGKGLELLERGVLTFLTALNRRPATWQSIWTLLTADQRDDRTSLPWYATYDRPLPMELAEEELPAGAQRLRVGCERAGCRPIHLESRAIFPRRFNQLVEERGNKAAALSQTTLELVRAVLRLLPSDEPIHVLCDKHGGRNKYGALLQETFPDTLAVVRREGRDESVYQLDRGEARRTFTFQAKGESFLPSALASMISKYLRELAMRAFNEYWTQRVTDLKPTAGYPIDARRFKQQIAGTQQQLGIADRTIWRCR